MAGTGSVNHCSSDCPLRGSSTESELPRGLTRAAVKLQPVRLSSTEKLQKKCCCQRADTRRVPAENGSGLQPQPCLLHRQPALPQQPPSVQEVPPLYSPF